VAQSLGSGVDFQEAKELQGKASLGETALLKEGVSTADISLLWTQSGM
jgi:hypothetical protein